jgi:RNA polymerase sigma factor (sigma-70 family)
VDDGELIRLVEQAQDGDRRALERVVAAVQDDVFHLALRMLGDPDDARDACQEVLVRVVTKLGSFRGESRLRTWVYSVATHALLNFRKTLRRPEISFDELGANLDAAVAAATANPPPSPADQALVDEGKLVCTQGMLLCLDRPHRLAYILGEILELPGDEAAAILFIQPAAYRQRLGRARAQMEDFLRAQCGLADPGNACRCHKVLPAAVAAGFVEAGRLRHRALPARRADRLLTGIERARTAQEIFRSLPVPASPEDFAAFVRTVLHPEEPS